MIFIVQCYPCCTLGQQTLFKLLFECNDGKPIQAHGEKLPQCVAMQKSSDVWMPTESFSTHTSLAVFLTYFYTFASAPQGVTCVKPCF